MNKKSIQLQQLNQKMMRMAVLRKMPMPTHGWVKAIRGAIGMSMQQLGNRLSISKQAVLDLEKREQTGAITIKALKEVAQAMDMELVYGFVPKDGTLEALVERRATEIAREIVLRTATTMQLEDQANSKKRIAKAIKERANALLHAKSKLLWD
ncbi:MAG: mobile mystery protein A [Chitinophagales bacterium]|jgi:predicted DNA-binding mobile mystery protein A|nr:mobile mystery protein A [Chitinophagales bacterium]